MASRSQRKEGQYLPAKERFEVVFPTRGWRLSFGVTHPESHRVGLSVFAVMVSITTLLLIEQLLRAQDCFNFWCSGGLGSPGVYPLVQKVFPQFLRGCDFTVVSLFPPGEGRTRGGPLGLVCERRR